MNSLARCVVTLIFAASVIGAPSALVAETHPIVTYRPLEREAVVFVGGCTAFVLNIDEQSYLVTAKHCRHPQQFRLRLQGLETVATLVHVHKIGDGAVVFKLQGGPFIGLPVSPEPPKHGDRVYSLGYPNGNWCYAEGKLVGSIFMQTRNYTNHQVNPGNSGGPLLNMDGQVIGIALEGSSNWGEQWSLFATWQDLVEDLKQAAAK